MQGVRRVRRGLYEGGSGGGKLVGQLTRGLGGTGLGDRGLIQTLAVAIHHDSCSYLFRISMPLTGS